MIEKIAIVVAAVAIGAAVEFKNYIDEGKKKLIHKTNQGPPPLAN